MPNSFHNSYFPGLKRVQQVSAVHCGPAVLEMLLSYLGRQVSQQQLVDAAGVRSSINEFGMNVADLGRAVSGAHSDLQFWYKDEARVDDIRRLIHNYNMPVGIEWQGNFRSEDDDGDYGHYSTVLGIDEESMTVTLADPYYPAHDRVFLLKDFERDWWDVNEVVNPMTGLRKPILDHHMIFTVTHKTATFPENLGMKRG